MLSPPPPPQNDCCKVDREKISHFEVVEMILRNQGLTPSLRCISCSVRDSISLVVTILDQASPRAGVTVLFPILELIKGKSGHNEGILRWQNSPLYSNNLVLSPSV